jgi:8-oxo-dGTP pyrophosphatase MutT (NUDIX family)
MSASDIEPTATIMSIPRLRASVLCIQDNRLLALRYSDPCAGEFWGVPGGAIEPDETPLQAAIRETREETGYEVELSHDPQLATEYDFVWKNQLYRCQTHWFAVRPREDAEHIPIAGDEDYITELRWIPVAEWRQMFSHHPEIQQAIGDVLKTLAGIGLVAFHDISQ